MLVVPDTMGLTVFVGFLIRFCDEKGFEFWLLDIFCFGKYNSYTNYIYTYIICLYNGAMGKGEFIWLAQKIN